MNYSDEMSFNPIEGDELNPKKEYLNLLNQRIALERQVDNIWLKYVKEFGEFMTRKIQLTINCIKFKKILSEVFKRKAIGEEFNYEKIKNELQVILSSFYDELDDICNLKDCETIQISEHEGILVKKLYREIVNMIHPDVHPNLFKNEKIRELWEEATTYYKCNDLEKLQETDYMILQELEHLGVDIEADISIDNIQAKIEKLKYQISQIINTDPYLLKFILESDEEIKIKTQSYIDEINESKQYMDELVEELGNYGIRASDYECV